MTIISGPRVVISTSTIHEIERNDIVTIKVSGDNTYLYIYGRCVDDITAAEDENRINLGYFANISG